VIIDQDKHMISMHKISRFDLLCSEEENFHLCDDEDSRAVGPIKALDTNSHLDPVFFFANNAPLETSRYEFHKS